MAASAKVMSNQKKCTSHALSSSHIRKAIQSLATLCGVLHAHFHLTTAGGRHGLLDHPVLVKGATACKQTTRL